MNSHRLAATLKKPCQSSDVSTHSPGEGQPPSPQCAHPEQRPPPSPPHVRILSVQKQLPGPPHACTQRPHTLHPPMHVPSVPKPYPPPYTYLASPHPTPHTHACRQAVKHACKLSCTYLASPHPTPPHARTQRPHTLNPTPRMHVPSVQRHPLAASRVLGDSAVANTLRIASTVPGVSTICLRLRSRKARFHRADRA